MTIRCMFIWLNLRLKKYVLMLQSEDKVLLHVFFPVVKLFVK